MRKFDGSRRVRNGIMLAVAILATLAALYGASGAVDRPTVLMAVLTAGSFLILSWTLVWVWCQWKEHLRYRALHDPLTDLPNRSLFVRRAGQALARAVSKPDSVAVLIVDLDDFEGINHGLGYEAGDQLLRAAGKRLQGSAGPKSTVARLCGDEFAVLLEDVPDKSLVASTARRIGEALRESVELNGSEVLISASIGVAIGDSGRVKAEDLLRDADVAMHAAKRKGKARHNVFDPGSDTTTSGRSLVESEMRRAIEDREFRVYYQPLVALRTGRIQGVEALVRWQHPAYGLIPPGEFIPLAEQTGLIWAIGRQVLQEACRQVLRWQTELLGEVPLALNVNVSACQFRRPNLVKEVLGVLEESGLDPRCLKLEITETVMMHDASAAAALRELKELGVELVMDDFGTGYSNLSYLKRLPIDTLKIDRSYISGLGSDAEDTAIVHATVAFAKALGLRITAEGIENDEQLARLEELGCELGQGYHFAKPLPSEELTELLYPS